MPEDNGHRRVEGGGVMSDKSESVKALDVAISNLASLYEDGPLTVSVNLPAFLTMVYNNVVELRERVAEREKEGE